MLAAAAKWGAAVRKENGSPPSACVRRVSVLLAGVNLDDGSPRFGQLCVCETHRAVEEGQDPIAAMAMAMVEGAGVLPTPAQFASSIVFWRETPVGGLTVVLHVVGTPPSPVRMHAVPAWLADARNDVMRTMATHFKHIEIRGLRG